MAVTSGVEKNGQVSSQVEVEALCRGAALLTRDDNRIAARALLWAAVAIDPQSFVAHRRLAAALLNAEDVDAAADEYARFIELLLKEDDIRRAAAELAYARSFLGEMPQLESASAHVMTLGEIAESFAAAPPAAPLQLAEYAASRETNSKGRPAQLMAETITAPARRRHHRRNRYWSWAYEIGLGEYILIVSVAAAATVLVIFAIGGLR